MSVNSKKITGRRLRRLLTGESYLYKLGIFFTAVMPFLFYLVSDASDDQGEVRASYIFCIVFGLILISTELPRRIACRNTLRHLSGCGELVAAIADLNCDSNYEVRDYPSAKWPSVVLGNRFIFLFSYGRILFFYQIASLQVAAEADKKVLRLTDTRGRKYRIISADSELIAAFTDELARRYPGCPDTQMAASAQD